MAYQHDPVRNAKIITFCDGPVGRTKPEIACHLGVLTKDMTAVLTKLRKSGQLFVFQHYSGGGQLYFAQWRHAHARMQGARLSPDRSTSFGPTTFKSLPGSSGRINRFEGVAPTDNTTIRSGSLDFKAIPSLGAFSGGGQ